MIGMNIQTQGHVFEANTPDQLDRLLSLLKAAQVGLALLFFGLTGRKAA